MSLHVDISFVAKRRLLRQRVMVGIASVLVAAGFLAVAGLLMDGVKFRPVPEYRPQFVMQEAWEPRGCGGLPDCHIGNPIKRKPTAPSSVTRPLGLAPDAPSSRLFMPLEKWDSAAPAVDFGEDESWICDSLGVG